jgi:hypothetical protein
MPAPVFRGTFPVTISETTTYSDRGKIQYTKVVAYQNANVTTGSIGSSSGAVISGKTLALTAINVNSKDGISEVTSTFTGGDTTAPEVYEVVASVQEEPIASHPAFTATTTGFASSIVDAAGSANVNFDGDNVFQSFSKTATNNFFGVQSFLSPQVQYRRIYSLGAEPDPEITDTVAYIYATPAGSPPTLASGRNWLKISVNIKNNGNQRSASGQFEVTEEYRGSGLKGWNPYIYFTA